MSFISSINTLPFTFWIQKGIRDSRSNTDSFNGCCSGLQMEASKFVPLPFLLVPAFLAHDIALTIRLWRIRQLTLGLWKLPPLIH